MRENTASEFYIQTYNFDDMPLTDIINSALEHFGPETSIEDLTIASERYNERGYTCSCCPSSDSDYDLYFCVYLRKC